MAHTCDQCPGEWGIIVAPTEDGYEQVRSYYRTGPRRHDHQSWKRTTRARKQYARHLGHRHH